MQINKPLVNRVAESSLITLNLEDYYPKGELVEFDLKGYLFRELILREKDFREALVALDWSQFEGKNLAVHCSAEAVIPMWAYMLIASYAGPLVNKIYHCHPDDFYRYAFLEEIEKLDIDQYADKRIVIKGCGKKNVPPFAYMELTRRLRPIVKSIMFGEPCSTVPIYKK